MFFNVLYPLSEYVGWFNLFQYLTVRSGGALMTAFLICLCIGPNLILRFRNWQYGSETVKAILPHAKKKGTPTMGGVMIVVAFLVSALLWADVSSKAVWLIIGTAIAFGAIGFADDWMTIARKGHKAHKQEYGLSGRVRLATEALFATAFLLFYMAWFGEFSTIVQFPFFKDWLISAGIVGFIVLAMLLPIFTMNFG